MTGPRPGGESAAEPQLGGNAMKRTESTQVRDLLMKKSGQAVSFLAGGLLEIEVGERIPTFSQFAEGREFSRGTLQNAMAALEKMGAVSLEKHGHMGTILTMKKTELLLECLGVRYVSGIMPLPYTKCYEGLATGLFNTITERSSMSVDIAYMRGSEKRIQAVIAGRYDFAVTSRLSAKKALEQGMEIELLRDFGPESYLKGQSLIFRDKDATEITPGMRVGVDDTSLDHIELTDTLVGDTPVQRVHINYSQIFNLLEQGEIDAAVWNLDTVLEHRPNLNYRRLDFVNNDENTAVLVVSSQRPAIRAVLDEYLDVDTILEQQRQVVAHERYPNY